MRKITIRLYKQWANKCLFFLNPLHLGKSSREIVSNKKLNAIMCDCPVKLLIKRTPDNVYVRLFKLLTYTHRNNTDTISETTTEILTLSVNDQSIGAFNFCINTVHIMFI